MQSFIDRPFDGEVDTSLPKEQLDQLKAELEEFLDEQRERLQRNEELFGALLADSSVDGTEREAAHRAAEQTSASIHEANRALEQMAEGTYGSCIRCGRSIPFERLAVVPRTRTCVACPDG